MNGRKAGPGSSQAMASPSARAFAQRERRPDLDWLRTLIVLAIIPYHALVLFTDPAGTVIRQPVAVPWAPPLYRALEEWGIPFIFLLAGAASAYALRWRSLGAYAWERVLRLVVPLALVAVLFAPVRAYYLALNHPALLRVSPAPITDPERMRNIGAFFLEYWRILFTTGTSIVSRNPIAHLWFVPRLIEISLIGAPLLMALRERWPRLERRLVARRVPLTALLLGGGLIPAALVVILQRDWMRWLTTSVPLIDNWPAFVICLFWFVAGAVIYLSARLRRVVGQLTWALLALALVTWGVSLGIILPGHVPAAADTAASILFTVTRVNALWMLTAALLGLGARFLSETTDWQPYLTSATFPVYVLHLLVLLPAVYYLQYLPLPWPIAMMLAILITLAGSFALYEYAVRRVPLLRLLFGLRVSAPAHAHLPGDTSSPLTPGGELPATPAASPAQPQRASGTLGGDALPVARRVGRVGPGC